MLCFGSDDDLYGVVLAICGDSKRWPSLPSLPTQWRWFESVAHDWPSVTFVCERPHNGRSERSKHRKSIAGSVRERHPRSRVVVEMLTPPGQHRHRAFIHKVESIVSLNGVGAVPHAHPETPGFHRRPDLGPNSTVCRYEFSNP
jgi:hypothetical protein